MCEYKKFLEEYTYQGDYDIIARIQNCDGSNERENMDIVNSIVLWKVNRQVNIGKRLFTEIKQLQISDITEFKKKETAIKEIIEDLLNVKGVRIAMASTILKMFYPNILPIIDQRAYRELYKTELPRHMKKQEYADVYIKYVYDCHNYYKQCYRQIDFRDLDKVLYQMDIDKGNKIHY